MTLIPSSTKILVSISQEKDSYTPPSFGVKLDHRNYALWSSLAISSLETFDLDHFVTGNVAPPTETIPSKKENEPPQPNPEFTEWKRKDKLILLWIKTIVSDSIVAQITNCKTSRQARTTLEKAFQSKSQARVMHLRWLLQTTTKGALTAFKALV